jgi:hypothetical protein
MVFVQDWRDTRRVAADWGIGQADERHRALLSQRFDPSRLSPVSQGRDEWGTWELHDGPHPRIEDPTAVGERLIFRGRNGTVSDTGGVGPALSQGQTGIVSTSFRGVGLQRHGYVIARCNAQVLAGEVSFDDGRSERAVATTSSSTGQHWLVFAVGPRRTPTSISFTDAGGTTLESQDIVTPPAPRSRRFED